VQCRVATENNSSSNCARKIHKAYSGNHQETAEHKPSILRNIDKILQSGVNHKYEPIKQQNLGILNSNIYSFISVIKTKLTRVDPNRFDSSHLLGQRW
jgi:hypothetical protein